MQSAVKDAYRTAVGRPDFSDVFESELLERLARTQTADRLSAEVAGADVTLSDLPPVTGFHVEAVAGTRKPCDVWLVWHHADGATRVPANVKTEAGNHERNQGCALGPLLSWLTDADGRIDAVVKGLDPDQVLIEMLAGSRKLQPGRDYLLIIARPDASETGRVDIRSLIARHGTGDTGLALARHPNRDVVVYHGNCGAVIGPEFDIARELATSLLPAGGATRLVAELLALVPPSKRRQLARTLVDMSTDDLVDRVISALN